MPAILPPANSNRAAPFCSAIPRAGEPAEFRSRNTASERGEGFARIALIPNPKGKAPVLVISGINTVIMEAPGEFIADPNSLAELTRSLGIAALRSF